MSNNKTTFFLPREEQIIITFDAFSTGYIANIGNPGDAPTEFTTVHASDVVTLGPFNDPKNYEINLVNGGFTSSAPQFLGAVDDDSTYETISSVTTALALKEDHSALAAIAESGLYTDLTITPETFIASPSTIGETDLKTAVDAIRALLIAKGLMAAS